MAKIALLAYTQANDERPSHWHTRKLLTQILTFKVKGVPLAVAVIQGELYRLNTAEPYIETKRRFRVSRAVIRSIRVPKPELCSPNESLDLAYPEPLRVTVHNPHPGFLAACQKARAENLQV